MKYKKIIVRKNDYELAKKFLIGKGIYPKKRKFVFDVDTAIVTGIAIILIVVLLSSLAG